MVEHELLDLEVDHHVSVELALEQPPQRLQVRDVVTDLGLAARGPPASRGHRLEEKPRSLALLQRPAGPGLEGAVIDHYGGRCGGQTLGGGFINRVGRGFKVLEREDLIHRFMFGSHFGSALLQNIFEWSLCVTH